MLCRLAQEGADIIAVDVRAQIDTVPPDPVDISNALVFLASDMGRYITGVQLPVDAGSVIN